MSTTRSSSERPWGIATRCSQIGRPRCTSTATTLPLARPARAMLPAISGAPVPRRVSTGTVLS